MLSNDNNATSEDDANTPFSSFFAFNLTLFVVGLMVVMWWGHSLATGEPFDSRRRMIGYGVILCGAAYLVFKGFRDMRRLPLGETGQMRITPMRALVTIGLLGGFVFITMWLLEVTPEAMDAG